MSEYVAVQCERCGKSLGTRHRVYTHPAAVLALHKIHEPVCTASPSQEPPPPPPRDERTEG